MNDELKKKIELLEWQERTPLDIFFSKRNSHPLRHNPQIEPAKLEDDAEFTIIKYNTENSSLKLPMRPISKMLNVKDLL